jgi:hypothetical protein
MKWVYVPMADVGAEFLFQVITERAERATVIITTNCSFQSGPRCSRMPDCVRHFWAG